MPDRAITQRAARVAAVAVVGLLLVACGGGGGGVQPTDTVDSETGDATVSMADLMFQPTEVSVPVGTEVTWTNDSDVVHTATAQSSLFDSGDVEAGGSFSFTFEEPGTFAYVCTYHVGSGMTGTVIVE